MSTMRGSFNHDIHASAYDLRPSTDIKRFLLFLQWSILALWCGICKSMPLRLHGLWTVLFPRRLFLTSKICFALISCHRVRMSGFESADGLRNNPLDNGTVSVISASVNRIDFHKLSRPWLSLFANIHSGFYLRDANIWTQASMELIPWELCSLCFMGFHLWFVLSVWHVPLHWRL